MGSLRPLPETGHLYPDLSVAGSNRSFEILVEVKIDAEIHYWELEDGTRLYQPDAYWRSWHENYVPEGEARARRIATLTVSGAGIAEAERLSAWVDLRWSGVGATLGELLSAGKIESEFAGVAKDVHAAITELILDPARKKPDIEDPLLLWGHDLLRGLGPALAARLPAARMKRQKPGVYDDYVGTNVYFMLEGVEALLLGHARVEPCSRRRSDPLARSRPGVGDATRSPGRALGRRDVRASRQPDAAPARRPLRRRHGAPLSFRGGGAGRTPLRRLVQVLPHRRSVTFMWSYPNMLPLPASEVLRIVAALEEWRFDRIWGAWWGRVIRSGAKDVVRTSAERYVRALR